MKNDPFRLSEFIHIVKSNRLNQFICTLLERILGLNKLSHLYQQLDTQDSPGVFIKQLLDHLDISYYIESASPIERHKPLLIISNHPFGALDGLILIDYLSAYRSDIRMMANVFLKRFPPVSDLLFGVNPFKDKSAKHYNKNVMREIYQWLQRGHCLITFPAGNVSYLHLNRSLIADAKWDQQVARLARSTSSDVLPVFIEGRNSYLFYLLGPHWHALLYGRELLNKKGKQINIKTGKLILAEDISLIKSDKELINHFRIKTESLSANAGKEIDPVD